MAAFNRTPFNPPAKIDLADGGGLALSAEQQRAFAGIDAFLSDDRRQVFTVFGMAGVGKSTLLATVARAHPEALICAPTGKGAANLRDRFDLKATTIHAVFHRLKSETQRADGRRDLTFEPRRRDGSLTARVLLLGECSMVTDQLRDEVLRSGVKFVAFGDDYQLPPVNGRPGFSQPDVTLTQIHRQAAGSSVIRQAHRVRAGGNYAPDGRDFRVAPKGSHDDVRHADILLCWTNESRHFLNQHCRYVRGVVPVAARRDGLFDPQSAFPRQGEPVVVLRNAPRHGVWNGSIEWLDDDVRPGDQTVSLFRVSESGDSAGGVSFPLLSFEGMPGVGGARDGLEITFGYSLTTHRAQGSEWRSVLLYDEMPANNLERSAWVYTGITRASERVVVVNSRYR